jgi:hypothetical protein
VEDGAVVDEQAVERLAHVWDRVVDQRSGAKFMFNAIAWLIARRLQPPVPSIAARHSPTPASESHTPHGSHEAPSTLRQSMAAVTRR